MVRDVHGSQQLRDAFGEIGDEAFAKLEREIPTFKVAYEAWYSECLALLKQVLSDRLMDFKRQYERPKNRRSVDYESYVIEDYMLGLRVTYGGDIKAERSAAIPKLQNQVAILAAGKSRFESSLFDIRKIAQADLFDSEIASARELHKCGFQRAAGVIAGVVLERHLSQVCADHQVKITKKNVSISDLNEALKTAGVIEVPQWRHISLLADIRNLCCHNKLKDPTNDQVLDLVDGTDKVLKTIA
jgi:hypothetical protein